MSHHKYNYVFVSVFSFYFTVFIYEVGLSKLSCYVEELFEARAPRHPPPPALPDTFQLLVYISLYLHSVGCQL
jgi:hypothetical protein